MKEYDLKRMKCVKTGKHQTLNLIILATLVVGGTAYGQNSMPMGSETDHQTGASDSGSSPGSSTMPEMNMGMGMSSSVDLLDPMSQEASGTAWLPSSTPVYGRMFMRNGNMLMVHGDFHLRFTDVGSKRGDRRLDAPNWFMGMYSHPLGTNAQLGLRAMMSLDPLTEGGFGYPLLYQTGETWRHKPLHDRQHPHDLFDELSATYSRRIGLKNSASLYVGYPGEPALGPPTYMHRLIAYDLVDAPIGHHWQDATHITFGVATAGLNLGSRLKFEGSVFTGREPNENRYNFDAARFDSHSGRISFNPNQNHSFQVSYGSIRNPEGDGVDQHRTTASWIYNEPLGDDANFTTTLVWGQNLLATEGRSNSYLAEADYQRGRNTVFIRLEKIQKSGSELVLPVANPAQKFDLGAYTVGYVHDLKHGDGLDTGIGAAVTMNTKPSSLDPYYGSGTPVSFQVFFRIRPSRMGRMRAMETMQPLIPMDAPTVENPSPPRPEVKTVAPAPSPAPPPREPAPAHPETELHHSAAAPSPKEAAPSPKKATPSSKPTAHSQSVSPHLIATVSPTPPMARLASKITVSLTDPDGKPITKATVRAAVVMRSMDMGTTRPTIRETGGGRYAGDLVFPMAGPWQVTLTVTVPGTKTPLIQKTNVSVVNRGG